MDLLAIILLGAIAGWLAGQIMKGSGFGLIINIIIGIVGSMIGGWVFSLLGLSSYGFIGSLVTATVGAIILLFIVGKIKK